MRFLITGGAGFLGSALSNQLAYDGHEVIALDNLSNGQTENLHSSVSFAHGDVNDIPLLWSLLHNVDCVYHLAARVSVAQSIHHPYDYNQTNVGGTVSLMEAMRDTGVRRVVFASSGAVYGQQTAHPVHEEDSPHPDSPYAVSKWAAEHYIHTIGHLSSIETVALRIFNAYGPQQNLPYTHPPVIPRFLQQSLSKGSMVIFGDGQQTRDFVYISDVVAALISAAKAQYINRQVINIGSGVETSIEELGEQIARLTGYSGHLLYNREKSGGVPRLAADISRAQTLLGYRPLISLEKGLAMVMREDVRWQHPLMV